MPLDRAAALDAPIPVPATPNSINDIIQSISPAYGTSDTVGTQTTLIDSTRTEADDYFNGLTLVVTSGASRGQSRTIVDYDGATGTFTVSPAFTDAIVSDVTYRVVTTTVYQPNITVAPSNNTLVEPDTSSVMNLSIITNNGAPPAADITAGTITITRVRAGALTNIVVGAACLVAAGVVYYTYTFPSASWQEGDLYLAYMIGQQVNVNGTDYPISPITFKGRVSREVAIETQTDKIPRILCGPFDFWGDTVKLLQLTGVLQANLALTGADVDIAGIPAGVTITRVVVMFMCRAIQNTNAGAANMLDGIQHIEVNFDGGAFTDAITFADDIYEVAADTREMPPLAIGKIDVKATVTGNGTCTFRIDAAKADLANLNFNDYQVGVRVYFTI